MARLIYFLATSALLGLVLSRPQQFSRDHTGVTGFGARSRKKTVFSYYEANTTDKPLKMRLQKPSFYNHTTQRMPEEHRQAITDEPKLWMCLAREPDTLYLKNMGERDDGSTEKGNKPSLQVSVSPDTGNWDATLLEDGELLPSETWVPVEGIYGLYPVPSGFLWVFITKSEPVFEAPQLEGGKNWWQIRRVTNLEVVHLGRPQAFLSEDQIKEQIRQTKLLRSSLKNHDFYFVPASPGGISDMTKTLQRSMEDGLSSTNNESSPTRWWNDKLKDIDTRFFWNEASVKPFLDRQKSDCAAGEILLDHTIPLTSAFVGIEKNITAGTDFSFTYSQVLISRRSRFRSGTRFTKRGADATGAVANYVETEQVSLITDKETGFLKQVQSHVQTRGSIPLRWSSPTDMKTYRPRIRIGTDALAQARALRLHLVDQAKIYSRSNLQSDPAKIIFVNLVDKHGDQGRLGKTFDEVLNAVLDVHNAHEEPNEESLSKLNQSKQFKSAIDSVSVEHVWFDFHAEVKNGKWDKLSTLLDSQKQALKEHGYFRAIAPKTGSEEWQIDQIQDGVIRTNCMDCLDRTNVVQSIFGRAVLFDQLSKIPKKKKEKKEWATLKAAFAENPLSFPWSHGELCHRSLWADNADAISRLYAGTDALKGDFTRTGRRTKRGALNDGVNSLQRFYRNNYLDADRQESIDLMIGYAPFSNVDHDDVEEELIETIRGKYLDISSVRDTVRQSLWHNIYDSVVNESDSDESQAKPTVQRPLDLRWLPGDLQHHLRDLAMARNVTNETISALEDIDRRSASDRPWWSNIESDDGADSNSSEDEDDEYKDIKARIAARQSLVEHAQHTEMPPAYFIAIMLLGVKAPMALAASIVGLMWLLSLPGFIFDDDD